MVWTEKQRDRQRLARRSPAYKDVVKAYQKTDKYKTYIRNYYDKNWLKICLSQAKRRAKAKGLEFDIIESDLIIPKTCPILEIEIKTDRKSKSCSPSLDRIDNTKGYTKDNVAIISNKANVHKSDLSIKEVENLLRYMKKENI